MLKFRLLLIFVFLGMASFGQAEVAKKRKQLNTHVQNKQWDEIKNIRISSNHYALSMRETEWFYLLSGNYPDFFAALDFNERAFSSIDKSREMYSGDVPSVYRWTEPEATDELNQTFIRIIESYWHTLLSNIQRAELPEDLIQFLQYYVYFTIYQLDLCDDTKQYAAAEEARNYLGEYPYSKYVEFVKKYSSLIHKPGKLGYSFDIGMGYGLLRGAIREHITAPFTFSLNSSLNIKNFVINMDYSLGISWVDQAYFYFTHHEVGRQLRLNFSTINLGYSFLSGERWVFTPLVGGHLTSIRGVLNPQMDAEGTVFRAATAFSLNYALQLEYNFKKQKCPTQNRYGNPVMAIRHSTNYLKLLLGRRDFGNPGGIGVLDGSFWYVQLAWGGFQHVLRTEPLQL